MSAQSDFWSRRKARVAQEKLTEVEAIETAEVEKQQAAFEEQSEAEILEELGLPDPDTLGPGDDFRGFMSKVVPDRIRRRALRKLWLSNPALANLDGLLDYGEDFTDKAKVLENMQTAYQVGKGMLAHIEEMARQAEEKEAKDAAEETPAVLAEARPVEDTEDMVEACAAFVDDPQADEELNAPQTYAFDESTVSLEVDESFTAAPRRRMQFAFDEHSRGFK